MLRSVAQAIGLAIPVLAGFSGCLRPEMAAPAGRDEGLAPVAAAVAAAPVCLANEALPRAGATASSSQTSALGPGNAIDGNASTRWSSAFSDPQWIRLDLGAVRHISSVTLQWETASSQRFDLQVSQDGNSWKGVKAVSGGSPGPFTQVIAGLSAKGRYLRLYSYARTTAYGVSLFEISAKGDPNGACTTPSSVRIDAAHSGKSLDVKERSLADGAPIHQWTFGGGNNQRWVLRDWAGDGRYEIVSVASDKCLDIAGRSTANGAKLQQWTCQGADNQRFTLRAAGSGTYNVVAVHSGKCLDVSGASTANGALLQQWTCGSGANQRFAFIDVQDLKTDPLNCGRAGHSCLGGACFDGVCQAAVVAEDFLCASSLAASETHFWVGDAGNLNRYEMSGYNKTRVYGAANLYVGDLVRDGANLFWANDQGISRLADGQASPSRIFAHASAWLRLTGATVTALDHGNQRFVSVDKSLAAPGPFQTVAALGADQPQASASTATHLYYVIGAPEGSTVWQVNRSTGAKAKVGVAGEHVYVIIAHGNTVYWNWSDAAGRSGIRKLSSAAGSTVQHAVAPVPAPQSISSPLPSDEGVYHVWHDGVGGNRYYRAPHSDPSQKTLVTHGPASPMNGHTGAVVLSNSIVWLEACNRGGPGRVLRLAKP